MRKATFFDMPEDEALALTDRAETMHLASLGEGGQPVLRALHVVRVGRAFYFHGAPVGEKTETYGALAVLSAVEDVARIPSHFLDPERACPATTLYRSVQLHGRLDRVVEPDEKARALLALMTKLQPEGGYVPITAESPLYTKALAGIDVARLVPDVIQGKKKLGQNRTPQERARLYAGLLGRGEPGDYAAVEAILGANPDDTRPPALLAEDGTPLFADLDEARIEEAAVLLEGAYWLEGVPRETVLGAFRSSRVRVGAAGSDGRLVAAARATSDGRVAWIFDVIVAPEARGRGLAMALMKLLLGHPAVRDAQVVRLGTRDAAGLYAKLGFADVREAPLRKYPVIEMARRRAIAST